MAGGELFGRTRTYDPVLRGLHAWNGLVLLGLIGTGQLASRVGVDWPEIDSASLWRIHLWLGYALVLGLVGRIIWAWTGPPHARWKALWHPAEWGLALKRRQVYMPHPGRGHHPLASAVYLAVYLLLLLMTVSGLALAAIDLNTGPLYPWLAHDALRKPWFRLPHEALHYPLIAFILVHLAALILHERRDGVPIAQAMISGYQYRKSHKDPPCNGSASVSP